MVRRNTESQKTDIHEEEIGQTKDFSRLMQVVLVVAGGVAAYAFVMSLSTAAPVWGRLFWNSLIAFVLAVLWHVLSKQGDRKLISIILTVSFIGVAAYSAFTGIGVRGTGYTLFLLIVMISALFVSSRAAYFTATAATVIGLGLVLSNEAGLMPNTDQNLNEISTWIIMSGFFFVTAVTLNAAKRQTDKALNRYSDELLKRERVESELQQLNVELEQRIQERTSQLVESEERYRLITMTTSDYAFSTNVYPGGTVVEGWFAGAFESITGYAVKEYLDHGGWLGILHPDDRKLNASSTDRLFRNEKIVQDSRILHKDGEVKWVRVFAHPVWDDDNDRLKEVYGAVKDISIQKQIEQEQVEWLALLENVIELGKQVSQITDLDKCCRQIHSSIQKGLGFDRVGIFIYERATDILRGIYGTTRLGIIEKSSYVNENSADNEVWQTVLSDPSAVILIEDYQEKYQCKPEDEMFGVGQHLTISAWAGEYPAALITVDNLLSGRAFTDNQINALKLFAGYAGLAIQNSHWNQELETRVEQRTMALEAANQELESFSYTMAHDLRTPARAMMGFVEILREEYEHNLDETGRHYLNRVSSGALRLGQMIDDLLDFIRLGRVTLKKQSLNLANLIRSVLADYQVDIEQRKIEVVIDDLPAANGDMMLLRQAFSALIDNAIKFTRLEPDPRIEIGSLIKNDETVYFVRDNGVGFSMEYADKLFGVFQRLHHIDEFEGVGVGLAVVNRVLQRHGGIGWIESKKGEGTTFYLTLGRD